MKIFSIFRRKETSFERFIELRNKVAMLQAVMADFDPVTLRREFEDQIAGRDDFTPELLRSHKESIETHIEYLEGRSKITAVRLGDDASAKIVLLDEYATRMKIIKGREKC